MENEAAVHVVQAERDLYEPVENFALGKESPPANHNIFFKSNIAM